MGTDRETDLGTDKHTHTHARTHTHKQSHRHTQKVEATVRSQEAVGLRPNRVTRSRGGKPGGKGGKPSCRQLKSMSRHVFMIIYDI